MTVRKTASKEKAAVGDLVTYQIEVKNEAGHSIDSFTVYDKIPAGFKYVENEATIKRENQPEEEIKAAGDRLIKWSGLSLDTGESLTITYPLVVGTGVVKDENYVNKAYVQDEQTLISSTEEVPVLITADPVFDDSIVTGKVFNASCPHD